MQKHIPEEFLERLKQIVPPSAYPQVRRSFDEPTAVVVRVNTLKSSPQQVLAQLGQSGIQAQGVDGIPEAFVFKNDDAQILGNLLLVAQGEIYQQGISSMLAVVALDPQPEERILDLCAAPGSKTSQIAARLKNTGAIVAVEPIRERYYKMKSVFELLGVANAQCLCLDGRRFEARDGLFDRVLVDAPCSSEGRFKTAFPKTFAYWSPRKIKEMVRKQRGILRNGFRQLKPGGTLIYATCTFAPEENEGVVDWLLRKEPAAALVPVEVPGVERYPALTQWQEKEFRSELKDCVRILPGALNSGFFIARIQHQG